MKKNRILIIEDDRHILQLMQTYFEKKGYEVGTAVNGKEGLEAYRKQPVGLVITDILMPVMGGFETIKKLREESNVPRILAMSAECGLVNDAIGRGADKCLKKPFRFSELDTVVSSLLPEK